MAKKILVVNPNSNEAVTDGLRRCVTDTTGHTIVHCCTIDEGPFGIESDSDIEAVVPLVVEKLRSSGDYDAFVIACYSDPGLTECRNVLSKPVFGMQQSALETAVAAGGRFGVLALSETSIKRHLAYIEALGFTDKLAGELPLGITVDEAANDPRTVDKVVAQGQILIDEFGADVLILGCAGMAGVKAAVETKLPVPVIEPAQAALQLAINAV